MNKCNTNRIPPLYDNNLLILKCKEKARVFNNIFLKQGKVVVNSSILPKFELFTESRLGYIQIALNKIHSLIKNINSEKAAGLDGISG